MALDKMTYEETLFKLDKEDLPYSIINDDKMLADSGICEQMDMIEQIDGHKYYKYPSRFSGIFSR